MESDFELLEQHRAGSGSLTNRFQRRRQAWVQPEIPHNLNSDSRYQTGAGYTLQYMVRDDGEYNLAPLRDPVSTQLAAFGNRVVMTKETINGFDAVRVSFRNFGGLVFWFVPSRGYALVKLAIKMDLPNQFRHSGWEVQSLKEIQPGIWFPLQANWFMESSDARPKVRYNYHAEDAVANDPNFNPDIINVEIPTGWIVYDQGAATRRTFIIKPDGSRLEIHTGDRVPAIKPDILIPPGTP